MLSFSLNAKKRSYLLYYIVFLLSCEENSHRKKQPLIVKNEVGVIVRRVDYMEEDSTSFNFINYYYSGKINSSGSYLKNLMSGEWFYYDSLGHVIQKECYKNGVILNRKKYSSDGTLKEECDIVRIDTIRNQEDSLLGINYELIERTKCK